MKNYEVKDFIKKYINAIFPRVLNDSNLRSEFYFKNNMINVFELPVNVDNELSNQKNNISNIQSKIRKELCMSFFEKVYLENKQNISLIFSDKQWLIHSDVLEEIIAKYEIFDELSKATNILWSFDIIEKYKDKWNWELLSKNLSINWNSNTISKYKDYLNLKSLSSNPLFPFTYEMLKYGESDFDWKAISINPGLYKVGKSSLHHLSNIIWLPRNYDTNDMRNNHTYLGNKYDIFCVCTNPNFKWEIGDKDFIKNKLDFWLICQKGIIEEELLQFFLTELDEEKIIGIKHTRCSDFRDSHPLFKSGWENYLENPNTIINDYFISNFSSRKIKLTWYDGNAQDGHTRCFSEILVGNLIKINNLNISFNCLNKYAKNFTNNIINEGFIDKEIYDKIISPIITKNHELLEFIFEYYLNADLRFKI